MPEDQITVRIVADNSELKAGASEAATSVNEMGGSMEEGAEKAELFGKNIAHITTHITAHALGANIRMANSILRMGEAATGLAPVLAAMIPVAVLIGGVEIMNKLEEAALKDAEAFAAGTKETARLDDKLADANEKFAGLAYGVVAEATLKLKDFAERENEVGAIIKANEPILEANTSKWKAYVEWVQRATDAVKAYATGNIATAALAYSTGAIDNTQLKEKVTLIEANLSKNKDYAKALQELQKIVEQLNRAGGPESQGQIIYLQKVMEDIGIAAKTAAKEQQNLAVELGKKKVEEEEKTNREILRFEEQRDKLVKEAFESVIRSEALLEEEKTKEKMARDKQAAQENERIWEATLKVEEESFAASEKRKQQELESIREAAANRQGAIAKGPVTDIIQSQSLAAQLVVAKSAMDQAGQKANELSLEMMVLNAQMQELDPKSEEYQKLSSILDGLAKQFDKVKEAQAQWAITGQKITAEQMKSAMTFKQAWQSAIDNTTSSFNKSFENWIIHGGSATKILVGMVQSMEQSFIQYALQTMERKIAIWIAEKVFHQSITTATAASDAAAQVAASKLAATALAGQAGAAGVASMAAAPFPIDLTAPTFGAAMAAAAGAFAIFEKGGLVGDTGPAMLHRGEMVLPAYISQHVMSTAANGEGAEGRQTTINYSPTVHGGDGVTKSLLKGHSRELLAMVRSEARRMNYV